MLTFGRFLFALALHVRGPEGEVVPQQLEEDVDEEEDHDNDNHEGHHGGGDENDYGNRGYPSAGGREK